jgi:N-acetylmuramoyl-L-alanine amidase
MRLPFLGFIAAALLAAAPVAALGRKPALSSEPLTAVVDGKIRTGLHLVRFEEVPFVSVGDIQRIFGGRQSWKRVSRTLTYRLERSQAEFFLDSATATVKGRAVPLEAAVRAWGDRVYVPVSFFTGSAFEEMAQSDVNWEAAGRVLSVEPRPSVSSPRFYSYADKSRVVVELGPRVHHRVMGRRGENLAIRLFGGRARGSERLEVKDGLIEAVHLAARPHSSELVLKLAENAGEPAIRILDEPRRLEVEVLSRLGGFSGIPAPDGDLSVPLPPLPAPVEPTLEPEGGDLDLSAPLPSPVAALSPIRTVVIDPGHGGKDAGAVGPHGTYEKDANLEIARALARVLKRDNRFRVIMTRNDDTFIPLEKRTQIANDHKADLFISIHCNAALSKASHGFEIYFLSENATDEAAAAVARRENAVIELEGLTDQAKMKVSQLLWSLARTETLNESSEVAALISRQVDKRLRIENRGVKQAAFYVLKGANMPAVLVESAFITHSKEEGLLRSSRFHAKLADAVYAGVLDYEKRKIQARLSKASTGGN